MIINLNTNEPEKQLISRCKKQDRKAQKEIFELHAPVMMTVCRRYMPDQDRAEELMLQGFMKAFEKLDQYKFEGSFQGWVRKIMVNTCLSWIRQNKMMYKEIEIENVPEEVSIEQIGDQLEAEDLMKLIGELPQGYGTIFNLYAIEGYTHNEIAQRLGISANTSKSQLSRARKYLQNKLTLLEKKELTKKKSEDAS